MKYFIIAGEASGDLHAANLMQAIKAGDPEAQFHFYGGDLMAKEGGSENLLMHYRQLAYMGILPVVLHLPQILRGMRQCKQQIQQWQPDCVILVDYPGFNLDIAKYVHKHAICPVYYYISPKIWAWKEYRIKNIRRDVDRVLSILPFEVDYFRQRHGYDISYVGNPTVDEVDAFKKSYNESAADFFQRHGLDEKKHLVALLAGSRKQEIKNNLRRMCQAMAPFMDQGFQIALAAAPGVEEEFYNDIIRKFPAGTPVPLMVKNETYSLLSHAKTALVTSGTATLETALFGVPQIVCYRMAYSWLIPLLRKMLLKTEYVSLVNLVCQREVVTELIATDMTVENVTQQLKKLLPEDGETRKKMLEDYEDLNRRLGLPGAPEKAAHELRRLLSL
ncbi:MAG: lipid-A-disaccharide synthase [Bacteroidaceae bacterium]|nr:lipid-A-disaccharide synthase [Bacteroidaceae bacterium]MBQ7664364.1 lipid-A-disaccharide synthase [Bacteroidaceae bacterium]